MHAWGGPASLSNTVQSSYSNSLVNPHSDWYPCMPIHLYRVEQFTGAELVLSSREVSERACTRSMSATTLSVQVV